MAPNPLKTNEILVHFRVPGAQKSLFRTKVTFSPKSDFWAPKSKKCAKVTFERKSRILAPGDRKKHQETVGYRHIGEPRRDKSLLGPENRKKALLGPFSLKMTISAKFRKIRTFRTRTRHGRKPLIMLVKFRTFGRSKSRKVTSGAKK